MAIDGTWDDSPKSITEVPELALLELQDCICAAINQETSSFGVVPRAVRWCIGPKNRHTPDVGLRDDKGSDSLEGCRRGVDREV